MLAPATISPNTLCTVGEGVGGGIGGWFSLVKWVATRL
jgi:hypothetical protein